MRSTFLVPPVLLACALTLVADGAPPASKPAGPVALLPEPMLRSVPREFSPKSPDDTEGRLNAGNWLSRTYAGQVVTLTGEAAKPSVKVGKDGENVVKFAVIADRPTRWLSKPVQVKHIVEQTVTTEEAARLAKLPAGRPAVVRLALKEVGVHWWRPEKEAGAKKEPEVGVQVVLVGTVESYTLR